MGDWTSFEQFVGFTEDGIVEGGYLRAVLALRKDDLDLCTRCVSSKGVLGRACRVQTGRVFYVLYPTVSNSRVGIIGYF